MLRRTCQRTDLLVISWSRQDAGRKLDLKRLSTKRRTHTWVSTLLCLFGCWVRWLSRDSAQSTDWEFQCSPKPTYVRPSSSTCLPPPTSKCQPLPGCHQHVLAYPSGRLNVIWKKNTDLHHPHTRTPLALYQFCVWPGRQWHKWFTIIILVISNQMIQLEFISPFGSEV